MELPQLVVELVGDYSKLMEDIKRARVEAVKQAQFLEKDLNLTIGVDDDSLKNLNKHFDLKVTHFKQTQTYFKNNPLKVFVDDNSLVNLNKELDKLGKRKTTIAIGFNDSNGSKSSSVGDAISKSVKPLELAVNKKRITEQIKRAVNDGGKVTTTITVKNKTSDDQGNSREIITSLKSVENAIRSQKPNAITSMIGKVVGGTIDNTVGSILRGSIENLGKQATGNLFKGVVESIEKSVANTIGSADLLGGKLGDVLISNIGKATSNIGKDLDKVLGKDISKFLSKEIADMFSEILGKENILKESAANRRVLTRRDEIKTVQSRDQLTLDRRDSLRALDRDGANLKAINKDIALNNSAYEKGSKLRDELTSLASLEKDVEKLKEIESSISEISKILESLIKEEESLLKAKEEAQKTFEASKKKAVQAKSNFDAAVSPTEIPKAFRDALRFVAGGNVAEKNIPKIVVDDASLKKMNAAAAYHTHSNTIAVTEELYKAINSGKLSFEQLGTLYHELQHAVDFNFGADFKSIQSKERDEILTTPATPTTKEREELQPFINSYDVKKQALELNAELNARRNLARKRDEITRQNKAQEYQQGFGVNGGKLNESVNRQLDAAKKNLLDIVEFSKKNGVKLESNITEYISEIQSAREKQHTIFNQLLKAQNLELNPEDLDKLDAAIEGQLNGIELLQNRLRITQLETIKKAKEIAEQAKTTERVRVDNINFAVNEAKRISSGFSSAYETLKTSLKSGDSVSSNNQAQILVNNLARAKKEIKETRLDLGADGSMGSSAGNQINQALANITRLENTIKRLNATGKINVDLSALSAKDVGENLGQAIGEGMEGTFGDLEGTSGKLTQVVRKATESGFEIKSPSRWGIRTGENIGDAIGSGARKSLIKANYEIAKLLGTMLRSNSGVIPIKKGSEVALLPSVSGKLTDKEKDAFHSFVSETLDLINESSMSYADDRMSVDRLLSNIQKVRGVTGSRVADDVFSTIIGQFKNSNENFSMYPPQTDTRNPEYWRRGNAFRRNLSHYNYGAVSEFGGSLTNYVPEQSGSLVPTRPYLPRSQSLEYYTRDLRPKFGAMTPPGSLVPDKKWLPKVDGSIFGKKNTPDWFAGLYPFRDKPGAIVKAQTMAISPYVEQTKGALSVFSAPLSSSIVPTKSRSPEFSLPLNTDRNSRDFSGMRSSGLYPIVKAQTVAITPYLKLAEGSLEKFSKGGEMAKHLSRIAILLGMDFGKDFNNAMVASLVLSSKRLSELVKERRGFATDTGNVSFVSEGSRYIAGVRKSFESADGILDQGKITSIVNELNILYEVLTRIGLSLGVTRNEINLISSYSISAVGKAIAPASKVNIPDRPTASSQTIDVTSEVIPETNQKSLSGFTQAQKRVMSPQEFYRNYINRNTPNKYFTPLLPLSLLQSAPQTYSTINGVPDPWTTLPGYGIPKPKATLSGTRVYPMSPDPWRTEPRLPNTSFVPPAYLPPQAPQTPLSYAIRGVRRSGSNPQLPNASFVPPAYTAPQTPQSISFSIPNTTSRSAAPQLPSFLPNGIPRFLQLENNNSFERISAIPGISKEDLASLEEANELIEQAKQHAEDFDNKYESVGKSLNARFAKASESINRFFEDLSSGRPKIDVISERFSGLFDIFNGLFTGFVAFSGFQLFSNFFQNSLKPFIKDSIQVAANLESIKVTIKSVSASSADGDKNVKILSRQSRDLGLDRQTVLEGATTFLASTQDTALEGDVSRDILTKFNVMVRNRNLSKLSQRRALVALGQMANKDTIQSEELRGQLAEALPGSYQTFARALGLNSKQLAQQLKLGNIQSTELTKFTQQAYAENITGIPRSLDTYQASVGKLGNSIMDLQENVGNAIIPLQKFLNNASSTGLDLVSKNIDNIASGIRFLAVLLTKSIWLPIIKGAAQFISTLDLSMLTLKNFASVLSPVTNAIKRLAMEFLLFTAVTEVIDTLRVSFTDLSGDLGKQIQQQTNTIKEYKNTVSSLGDKLPNQRSWSDDLKVFGGSFVSRLPIIGDNGESQKVRRDTELKIAESRKNTSFLLGESDKILTNGSVVELNKLDSKISNIQAKIRALVQFDPKNADGLKKLKDDEKELLEIRQKQVNPIGNLQSGLSSQIEIKKNEIEYLKELKNNTNLYGYEIERNNKALAKSEDELKKLEKAQTKITQAVGKTLTAFDLMQRQLRSVSSGLEDAKVNIESLATGKRVELIDRDITPGQRELATSESNIETLKQKLKYEIDAISQYKALFDAPDIQRVLKAFKVNDSTGVGKINEIIEKVEDSKDRYVLQQFADYQKLRNGLNQSRVQISEAQLTLRTTLYEQNKQIAEYYLSLNKQAQEIAQVYKELVNTNNLNTAKNKIRSAVLGYQDNFITQFADSIIQILDTLNQPVVALLQGQREIDQAKFNLLNEKRQIQETQRSNLSPITPGNGKVTSEFGWRTIFGQRQHHNGIDYGVPIGTPVKAPTSGKVSNVFNDVGGGLTVTLSNINAAGQKVEQSFLHLSQSLVKVGDVVQKGQVIAKSGNSGSRTTEAHLDYRVKVDGKYINPRDFLKSSANPPVAKNTSTPPRQTPTISTNLASKKNAWQQFTNWLMPPAVAANPNQEKNLKKTFKKGHGEFRPSSSSSFANPNLTKLLDEYKYNIRKREDKIAELKQIQSKYDPKKDRVHYIGLQSLINGLTIENNIISRLSQDTQKGLLTKSRYVSKLISARDKENERFLEANSNFSRLGGIYLSRKVPGISWLAPKVDIPLPSMKNYMGVADATSLVQKQKDLLDGTGRATSKPSPNKKPSPTQTLQKNDLYELIRRDYEKELVKIISKNNNNVKKIEEESYKAIETIASRYKKPLEKYQTKYNSRLTYNLTAGIRQKHFEKLKPTPAPQTKINPSTTPIASKPSPKPIPVTSKPVTVKPTPTLANPNQATLQKNPNTRPIPVTSKPQPQPTQVAKPQLPVIPKNLPKPLAKDGSVEFAAPQPQPQEFVSPQLQQAERNLRNTITNAKIKINIEASQSDITATAQENKALMALARARMENRRSPIGVFREIEDMGLNLSQQNPERELLSQKFQIERNREDKLHQITMAKFDQEQIKGANEDLLKEVRKDTRLRPRFKIPAIKQLELAIAESKKIIEEYDEYLKLVPKLIAAATEKANSEHLISENLRKFSLKQQISQAQASGLRSKSRGNLQLNAQADLMDLNSKYAGEISGLDEEIRKESDPEMVELRQEQKKLALIAALRDSSNIQRNLKIQERDLEFSQKEKLNSSNNAISSEKIRGQGLFGIKDKNLEKAQALSQIKMDFEREKMEIEKFSLSMDLAAEKTQSLLDNLNKLNELKLDNVAKEFNMFTEAIGGIKGDVDGIFKDFFMNTKSFGESISSVFQSILNNLANMASKELSNQLFTSVLGDGNKGGGVGIFSLLGGLFGGSSSGFGGLGGGGGASGMFSGGMDYSGFLDGAGGFDFGTATLPSFAKGGMVGDLLNKERSLSGFNPRLIIANEGERVLTPKETKLWNQLNSSNKLESFSSGGMVGQGLGNINNVGRSGDTINITPNVNINNEGGGNINKALFEKALEAKIQETIKQERRPGGSLNRGGLYDR